MHTLWAHFDDINIEVNSKLYSNWYMRIHYQRSAFEGLKMQRASHVLKHVDRNCIQLRWHLPSRMRVCALMQYKKKMCAFVWLPRCNHFKLFNSFHVADGNRISHSILLVDRTCLKFMSIAVRLHNIKLIVCVCAGYMPGVNDLYSCLKCHSIVNEFVLVFVAKHSINLFTFVTKQKKKSRKREKKVRSDLFIWLDTCPKFTFANARWLTSHK